MLVGCAGKSSGPPAPAATPSNTAAYVDPESCRACHAEIADSSQKLGMARTFGRVTADEALGKFEQDNQFIHPASGQHFMMLRRGDRFFQERYELDAQGERTHVFEMEITHFIGSGNAARTYLNLSPHGELTQLPVSWYAQEQAWGMSPGYDRADHDGFARVVGYKCVFCHNAVPDLPAGWDQDTAGRFPRGLPSGIDCQRCHGPGSAHVRAAQRARNAPDEIRRTIVNPARLSAALQRDVCFQCHMETTSAPLPPAVRRAGRGVFSFRPGEPLTDYELPFDHPPGSGHDDKFEIAHHGYRLLRSACVRADPDRMTCTTCHDPHRVPADRIAFQREKCLSCHKSAGCAEPLEPRRQSNGDDCAGCHMPRRRTEDAVHVVMTDHWIQRRPAARDLTAPLAEKTRPYQGPLEFYFPDATPIGAERDLYLGLALVKDEADLRTGIRRLRQAVASLRPRYPEPYYAIGFALLRQGDTSGAVEWLRRGLQFSPDHAQGQYNLGVALGRLARWDEAVREYERALKLQPDDPDARANLGHALAVSGRSDQAVAHLQRAVELRPTQANARRNLAVILKQREQWSEADEQFQHALVIDPRHAETHFGRGRLQMLRHDFAGALASMRRAVALAPDNVEMADMLAWVLATSPADDLRDGAEAVRLAEQVEQTTRGQNAQALDTLAAAYAEVGRFADAIQSARRGAALATSQGLPDLASDIRSRIPLYEAGRPYHFDVAAERSNGGRRKERDP